MKKIIALVLVLLMAVGLFTACGNGEKEYKNRLEKILAEGVLVVGTSPDFAPTEFIDSRQKDQDQYVGVDMEFARYIANELGVKLKIEAMDFSAVQTAVSLGQVDLALSGFAKTEKRAESMELSDYYNNTTQNGQGLLVMKDQMGQYQKAEDFDGKVIAVQNASLQLTLLQEQLPNAVPELVKTIDDGVMMLLSGKVDAVGVAGTNGLTICKDRPQLAMSAFKYDYESKGTVVAATKGETELIAKVNEIIKKATDEGKFVTWLADAEALAQEIGWVNPD